MKNHPKIKFAKTIVLRDRQVRFEHEIEGPVGWIEDLIDKLLILESKVNDNRNEGTQ